VRATEPAGDTDPLHNMDEDLPDELASILRSITAYNWFCQAKTKVTLMQGSVCTGSDLQIFLGKSEKAD
jgi:hypothetical protein